MSFTADALLGPSSPAAGSYYSPTQRVGQDEGDACPYVPGQSNTGRSGIFGGRDPIEGQDTMKNLTMPKSDGGLAIAANQVFGDYSTNTLMTRRRAILWLMWITGGVLILSAIAMAFVAAFEADKTVHTFTTYREYNNLAQEWETRLQNAMKIHLGFFVAAAQFIAGIAIVLQLTFSSVRAEYFANVLVHQRNFERWVIQGVTGGMMTVAVFIAGVQMREFWLLWVGGWTLFGVSCWCFGFVERYTNQNQVILRKENKEWIGNNVKFAGFIPGTVAWVLLIIMGTFFFARAAQDELGEVPILAWVIFILWGVLRIAQWIVNFLFQVWSAPSAAGLDRPTLAHSTYWWMVEIPHIVVVYLLDVLVIGWLIVGLCIQLS